MRAARPFEGAVPLGIEDQLFASCGDHIAYFWESEAEFVRGVRFIQRGLEDGDHCVVFGHEEANARVFEVLRANAVEVDELTRQGRLSTVGGQKSGDATLDNIAATFERLVGAGATRLRLLGNIGWGHSGWPRETDILAFESRVTGAIAKLPCVVVCMYDVRSLPGRIILHGAFETHPLTFCRNVLRENPSFVPIDEFLATLPDRSE